MGHARCLKIILGLCWQPRGQDSMLPMQGAWVQSLLGEPGSCMSYDVANTHHTPHTTHHTPHTHTTHTTHKGGERDRGKKICHGGMKI